MKCFPFFRPSLPQDAGKYFDEETRILEVPMTIGVSDQVSVADALGNGEVVSGEQRGSLENPAWGSESCESLENNNL